MDLSKFVDFLTGVGKSIRQVKTSESVVSIELFHDGNMNNSNNTIGSLNLSNLNLQV